MEWESSSGFGQVVSSIGNSTCTGNIVPSAATTSVNYSNSSNPRPYLEIGAQPQTKFRFRYKSEMTGKHGSLLGIFTGGGPGLTPSTSYGSSGNNNNTNIKANSGPTAATTISTASTTATTTAAQINTPSDNNNTFGQMMNAAEGTSIGNSNTYNNPNIHHQFSGNFPSLATSSSTLTSTSLPMTTSVATKVFPTVKLHNFPSDAIIRCSLVCESSPYYPHPHLLEMGQSAVGTCPGGEPLEGFSPENCFIEIPVSHYNEFTASFQGLNIIYVSKKDMRRQLLYKMTQLDELDSRKLSSEKIDDISLSINLNVVALYFEAFIRLPDSRIQLLCNPVVSNPIQHNKSTQTGDLRIVRIDKFSSCCTGNEEVFILVEKVDKHNIQVKFYQESDKGVEIWKAYGKFSKLDVHHQYAIVFKTPPYRTCDIDTEVDVWIQLERPTDGATSQPIRFQYRPIERIRKMPKRQRSRGGGSDSQDFGRSSRSFEPPRQDRPDSPGRNSDNSNNPSGNESDQDNGNNPLAGSSSNIRQGSNQASFPCDTSNLGSDEASSSKTLAMSVALSICQGLHTWAETSEFNPVLQKLRHLLCLVNEKGNNALHSSIMHQQREPFKQILETLTSSPDTANAINEPNIHNLTPIALAVLNNRMDFIQDLLQHNADLTLTNSEGDTPIHLATKMNNIQVVAQLLQASTSSTAINKLNYSSMTPLHIAVANGSTDMVELLCRNKASLRTQDGTYGRTPLHLAVEKETKENIISTMVILKYGRDSDLANVQNYRGDTPLHQAANAGHTTFCALLMYHGGDPLIENHVRKETEEDDEEPEESEERLNGQTVFDTAASDQVLRILKGTLDDWEVVLKACSLLPTPVSLGAELRQHLGTCMGGDCNSDSKFLDSGIDINNSSASSQFLSQSSTNQLSDT